MVKVTFETTEEVKKELETLLDEVVHTYRMFAEDTSNEEVHDIYIRLSEGLCDVVNQIKGVNSDD